jgi:hypothetical protein
MCWPLGGFAPQRSYCFLNDHWILGKIRSPGGSLLLVSETCFFLGGLGSLDDLDPLGAAKTLECFWFNAREANYYPLYLALGYHHRGSLLRL